MSNTARTQTALAASPHFQSRVSAALGKIAWQVLNEVNTTTNHTQRVAFARQVIGSLSGYAAQIAQNLVERPNVFNDPVVTSYDFEIGAVVTSATDAAIESQLATDWDRLSGV